MSYDAGDGYSVAAICDDYSDAYDCTNVGFSHQSRSILPQDSKVAALRAYTMRYFL